MAIAYHSVGQTNWKVGLVSAEGRGTITSLTPTVESEQSPAWSPSGDKIAFTRGAPAGTPGNADLWVMNADGSGKTLLVDAPLDQLIWSAAWSPDGTTIVYSQLTGFAGNVDLYTVPAAGGPHRLRSPSTHTETGGRPGPHGDLQPAGRDDRHRRRHGHELARRDRLHRHLPRGLPGSDQRHADGGRSARLELRRLERDCTGTGACVVPMVGYRDVFAEFNLPPPPPPPGGGGGGGFIINPDLGVSITSSNNAPAVYEVVEFRVLVPTRRRSGTRAVACSDHVAAGCVLAVRRSTTRLRLHRHDNARLNLNFLAASATSLIRFSMNVGAGGAKTVTATLTMNTPDPNPAHNTASLAFEIKAPTTAPPAAGPKAPASKTLNGTARANTISGTGSQTLSAGLAATTGSSAWPATISCSGASATTYLAAASATIGCSAVSATTESSAARPRHNRRQFRQRHHRGTRQDPRPHQLWARTGHRDRRPDRHRLPQLRDDPPQVAARPQH